MAYRLERIEEGMRHRNVYVEEPNKIEFRKGKIRKEIEKQVSDRDDLIADLFKLSFLTISALKHIYEVVDKDKIEPEVKELLDYSFNKYTNTKTILDLYLGSGDTSFIDRILERQEKITNIVKG